MTNQEVVDKPQEIKNTITSETGEILEMSKPELPKPLLSICVITTKEDMDKFGQKFLQYLPKSPDVELVVLLNKQGLTEELKLIKDDTRLLMYDYTYVGYLDFANLRNKCKEFAKGEWIFALDIDEILLDIYHKDLLDTLKEYKDSKYNALRVGTASSWYNPSTKKCRRENAEIVKIFRNKKEIKYYGSLHEAVEWTIYPEEILESTLQLLHFGYDLNVDELIKKLRRNVKGLSKILLELESTESNYDLKFEHYSNYLTNTITMINELLKIK